MNIYKYEIKENIPCPQCISMIIYKNEQILLDILGTLINADIGMSPEITLQLLHHINLILHDEKDEYQWLGEACAVYIHKEKSMIVYTFSGFDYDENYEYDFENVIPPDICDYEEIETTELKKLLEAWYHAVINFRRET